VVMSGHKLPEDETEVETEQDSGEVLLVSDEEVLAEESTEQDDSGDQLEMGGRSLGDEGVKAEGRVANIGGGSEQSELTLVSARPHRRRRPSRLVPSAIYLALGLVLLVSIWQLASTAAALVGWNNRYAGEANFVVDGCERLSAPSRLAPSLLDQGLLACGGTVRGGNVSDGAGLVAARGSLPNVPASGTEVDVYFDVTDPGEVYPSNGRFLEPARQVFRLVPLALLTIGTGLWLVGRAVAGASDSGRIKAVLMSFGFLNPQERHRKSTLWMAIGALLWLVDMLWVDALFGTIGLVG